MSRSRCMLPPPQRARPRRNSGGRRAELAQAALAQARARGRALLRSCVHRSRFRKLHDFSREWLLDAPANLHKGSYNHRRVTPCVGRDRLARCGPSIVGAETARTVEDAHEKTTARCISVICACFEALMLMYHSALTNRQRPGTLVTTFWGLRSIWSQ